MTAEEPIRLLLEVDDDQLREQLTTLLANVPGLRIVTRREAADVVVATPEQPRHGPATADVSLTPREVEVLALLAAGASNKSIAQQLGISVHTAKFHVSSLIDKLDALGRTDVVAHAARLGVIRL